MVNRSFTLLATQSASTKRPAPVVSGVRSSTLVTGLTGLRCTEFYAHDGDTTEQPLTSAVVSLWLVYALGDFDIKRGDYLVIGAKEYAIRSAVRHPWVKGEYFMELTIEIPEAQR